MLAADNGSLRRWAWAVIALTLLVVPLSYAIAAIRRPMVETLVPLSVAFPQQVGQWRQVTTDVTPVDPSDRGEGLGINDVYDAVESRTYRNAADEELVLTLAYRRVQTPEAKIHRPELCYYAQGYTISRKTPLTVADRHATLAAQSFLADGESRSETVAYWIRIGEEVPANAWQTRLLLFRYGLKGRLPDGILVRASILGPKLHSDTERMHEVEELRVFLMDLSQTASPAGRRLLVGTPT